MSLNVALLTQGDQEVLSGTAPAVWEELRGGRMLITGGTGFVGTWVIAALAWANAELDLGLQAVAVSRDPAAFRSREPWTEGLPWLELVQGDVREACPVEGAFSHAIVGAVSADPRSTSQASLDLIETIVAGGVRALRAARGARSALILSSGAVYGRALSDAGPIPEGFVGRLDGLDPRHAYHEGKRCLESAGVAATEQLGLDVKIARLFTFIGPLLPTHRHYAAGNFIRNAVEGGPIVVRGDGSPVRSYLYAADMAAWLLTVLIRGESRRPYNVGSRHPVSVRTLAELISARCGTPHLIIEGREEHGGGGNYYLPDTTRACEELGLHETVGIEDAIDRTIRWETSREMMPL